MRRPSRAGVWAIAGAAAVWAGAASGFQWGPVASLVITLVAMLAGARSRPLAILILLGACGSLSGALSASRIEATMTASLPAGPIEMIATVSEDGGTRRPSVVRPEALVRDGVWVAWNGPPLGVSSAAHELVAGERVRLSGVLRAAPGLIRGDPVAGRVTASRAETLDTAGGVLYVVGNAVRDRVRGVLDTSQRSQALVAGFLIGDTSGIGSGDLENLRRTGLTHFVAVSGSNVALFLAGWWVVTAVFGVGPLRRFAFGVVGLAIFVVVTRWEASVLRAAFMAALVLGASAAGVALDAWVAIGVSVGALILVGGHLALDVGFQLSVAATVGILVGAEMFGGRRPRPVWATLGAATAAQAAVVPILLVHFGSVPLLSPIANLVAAPLVSASTVAGAIAVVIGWGPAVAVSASLAGLVLQVADLAADWPQLGVVGVAVALGGVAAVRLPRTRPLALAVLAVGAAFSVLGHAALPEEPTVTFLDVGQGDAVVLRDTGGGVALIDGGRDPFVLAEALCRNGIGRVDLLVASHGDVDHVGGFDGVLADHAVGRLWVPDQPDAGPELESLIAAAQDAGIPVDRVRAGIGYRLGALTIQAVGPQRRYQSRNDGSIVLWVDAGRSLLLAGDIEALAQSELPPFRPDILLVPHHGAGTTDPAWLARTVGDVAVVSVGENTYGHPVPAVLSVLADAGATVHMTLEQGDVSLPLSGS